MNEPKLALDSILESDEHIGSLTVHPMTIGRMALLELADSPLVKPGTEFTLPNMITTVYIATASNEELKGITTRNLDKLHEDAWKWSLDIDVQQLPEVVSTLMSKLQKAYKIAPGTGQAVEDTKKKA